MEAPKTILELVERFDQHSNEYRSPDYNEAQVRREFIDPFFDALGWDIQNRKGFAEPWKEVVHEDSIKVGGATKAPDYSFRLGGRRLFFLEAKKPGVNLKDDPSPAYQLRRYAWTAKLPISILTDFEEFIVYDTRVKPAQTDKPSAARILYIPYTEYLRRWEEIASVFSPSAIQKGSLDKYVAAGTKKRGTAEVDDAFLADIEEWRELLARNIALRNRGLSQRELNFAVQCTIDRIIFLRICEDRAIEPFAQLMSLLNGEHVYERLRVIYERADERYNSGLLHFHRERDRPTAPDTLTPRLAVDDKVLKIIFRRLYYPECPYEFSVLPAEILGQVYERFLGSVIRLTSGHQAKVEEKPEVRKAGGVYYTPTYIVDYIVKHTVGKLLEGKTPQEVAGVTDTWRPTKTGRALSILDPACGSGAFLLGAYQCLLDWHLDYYMKDAEKWSTGKEPRIYQHHRAGWRVTTGERKRILLTNIYGVDIDPQAVEVTKLSLLLKVLEGEDSESLQRQLTIFHQRALPDLGGNVKCGNSLIGPDFYHGKQLDAFDEGETYRINAFDWNAEFPRVMQSGGFDGVIGNPPYIRIQTMKEWAPVEVEFYKEKYRSAASGNYDIYVVFIERGLSLLNKGGLLGFICPHKFFNAKYGESLRALISTGKHLAEVVHFGDQQVFEGATTYTCLLFLDKAATSECHVQKVADLDVWRVEGKTAESRIASETITAADWNFVVGRGARLFDRLSKLPTPLASVAEHMAQGIRTSANEVYVLDLVRETEHVITAHSTKLDRAVKLERKGVSLFLQGREIKPYRVTPSGKVVIVPYVVKNGQARLIPEAEIRTSLPLLYSYLVANKDYLGDREKGRMRGPNWYAFIYPKNIDVMRCTKILVPDIADRASFALDEAGDYAFTSGYGITLRPDVKESVKYILALLNSSLLDFYLKRISTTMRGGFFRYFTQFIAQLPIRRIDFTDHRQEARHDELAALAQRMLDLYKRQHLAKTDHERGVLERQVTATSQEIDQLVYELYGLSSGEISIVEGSRT
ncbi:MAG: Eco57I restriction-modification methylase domain-containing protein [Candidatus Hydrogenedentes bacterium]|nr:Eco57I restriction-modification methylase domain-containing protein [Candidatus Hydrogenedentota bacterium]